MFENIKKFFNKTRKKEEKKEIASSKDAAKERLHLVLMQDRANVSADFLELMKQEIIEVIKKYIEVDEKAIDVRLTNKENEDGTNGAPALYANIPIITIKNEARKLDKKEEPQEHEKKEEQKKDKQEKVEEPKKSEKEEVPEEKEQEQEKEEPKKQEKKTKKKKEENLPEEEKIAEEQPVVEKEEKTEKKPRKTKKTTENK